METKTCTACGQSFPVSAFYFCGDRRKDGTRPRRSICIACHKQAVAARGKTPQTIEKQKRSRALWYREHRAEITATQREWQKRNPKKWQAIQRRYRETHREKMAERRRLRDRARHKELAAYAREYRLRCRLAAQLGISRAEAKALLDDQGVVKEKVKQCRRCGRLLPVSAFPAYRIAGVRCMECLIIDRNLADMKRILESEE